MLNKVRNKVLVLYIETLIKSIKIISLLLVPYQRLCYECFLSRPHGCLSGATPVSL